jgi:hypothetical protein
VYSAYNPLIRYMFVAYIGMSAAAPFILVYILCKIYKVICKVYTRFKKR